MKIILAIISTLYLSTNAFGQVDTSSKRLNLDFEKIVNGVPENWENYGSNDYVFGLDSLNRKSGHYSATIEYTGTTPAFKAIALSLPKNYEGKKITLTGYIKTDSVQDGHAGLWMRIDPNIAFDNMSQKGVKGTSDWKKYEITLPMDPKKTKQIVVGGLLVGKGKMWLDDLHITIDGKNLEDLVPIPLKIYPADKDKEFDTSSGIKNIELTKENINTLKVLGLVWGFVKYYHPNVAAGNYNMDYELFRILPKILKTKNAKERDALLMTWMNGLGVFETIHKEKDFPGKVAIKPDLDWIRKSDLSVQLTASLETLSKAKLPAESYYIGMAPFVGNPEFKNEKPYPGMNYPDAGFRLLTLYRYWNTIQYFFPYKDLIDEDWKNVLAEFIPKLINAKDELAYKLAVLELIGRIHDTHANIYGQEATLEKFHGVNMVPLAISFIENKPVVTGIYEVTEGEKSALQIGDVISEINKVPVDKLVRENLKYTPASNYSTQLRVFARYLLRTNDSILPVTYVRNGKKSTINLKALALAKIDVPNSFQKKDTCFKMLSPEIAYLYPGSIKNAYLPEIWKKIENTKGLIIDMRSYPLEFIVFSLGQYLMPESTEFVKFSTGHIEEPGLFTIGESLKVGKHNPDYYKGKIVILVNEITQSQGEYTTMAFRAAPDVTVLGSTTAGADGNVSSLYLPGGISTMISGIGVFYPDGRGTQRVGIVPDIILQPTIQGIKEGKDELVEKAIDLINKK